MYTVPETYEDYFKWYYVFIMSNSPRFRKKSAKSCPNLRKPANNPEQICAAFSG